MVIIIDDCLECRHHFMHYGSVVICSYHGMTTARHVYEAPWGPVFVSNCPLANSAELFEDEEEEEG
ncbi:MAG TPA: hypothetical protein PKN50_10305 [Spirochaetota bacterium]|jgi:hypothetical protein|nr:hypothetical protein [Spirochaetota bacterium]HPV42650.1 hypothetical protein [Spirochaetota bacterium]